MNRFLTPRSIEEWLCLIPYVNLRETALQRFKEDKSDLLIKTHSVNCMSTALLSAFMFDNTPEGREYWQSILIMFYNMERSVRLKK